MDANRVGEYPHEVGSIPEAFRAEEKSHKVAKLALLVLQI